jgi:hypothetical protein
MDDMDHIALVKNFQAINKKLQRNFIL